MTDGVELPRNKPNRHVPAVNDGMVKSAARSIVMAVKPPTYSHNIHT
jgi:hypothetical protein